MKKCLLYLLPVLVFVYNVHADEYLDTTNMTTGEKMATVSTLESDILILEAEVKKCQKNKKGWIAATVIGSAGVVATGIAAGVQGAQISKKKAELAGHNQDIVSKQNELSSLQQNK